VIHRLNIIQAPNNTHILIRSQNHHTTHFRINTIVLVCLAMALIIRLVIHINLHVIPAIALVEWTEDLWEVKNINRSPRCTMDDHRLDD
jgi:hypothetical protein